ncbi:uncharacterized protein [Bemisia tabaci]|uniref:uncharacterized protein n=1 Tax=Bemisia tabaci TaxID=7038 RepID=UPI003B285E0C
MDNAYHKMSMERSLEEELISARMSLRRQTIRCHQIISALVKKMQDKEKEAQAEKQLRDRQLSGVLRSLYNLEARLRREQRAIRQQLLEKDNVIAEQQREIERLRRAGASSEKVPCGTQRISVESQTSPLPAPPTELRLDNDTTDAKKFFDTTDAKKFFDTKPDLITSIIVSPTKNDPHEDHKKPRVTFDTDCIYFPNDSNIMDNFDSYEFNQNSLESFGNASSRSDSDVEFKNEINSFDLIKSNVEPNDSIDSGDRTIVPESPGILEPPTPFKISQSPRTLIQEVKIGSENDRIDEYYQNNPVLKCVNQILLRDEEDYLEARDNLQEQRQASQESLKPSSSPRQTQNSEPIFKTSPSFKSNDEKFLYPLQSKLFTPPRIMSNCKSVKLPPALPPKPQCLLKSKPKISFNSSISTNPFITSPEPGGQKLAQPIRIEHNEKISSVLEAINNPDSPFPKPPSPNDELYVISNSALSGHDDDYVDELMTSHYQPGSNDNSTKEEQPWEQLCADKLLEDLTNSNESKSDLLNLLPNMYHSPKSDKQVPSSVSQMVKKFENITKVSPKTKELAKEMDLSQNFEEFCLEDCDMESVDSNKSTSDSSRISAEGAEVLGNPPEDGTGGATYENFLEATGLSQKSIMTPSRMFSNHKHVMKPKDVKHRNKVNNVNKSNNVGLFQRCSTATSINGGPTIKYWTEPFL